MARIALTVQQLARNAKIAVTLRTMTTGGVSFDNSDGNAVLAVFNDTTGAATPTVTIVSVGDQFGRTGNYVAAMAAGEHAMFGPFKPPSIWNQGDGTLQANFATVPASNKGKVGAIRQN